MGHLDGATNRSRPDSPPRPRCSSPPTARIRWSYGGASDSWLSEGPDEVILVVDIDDRNVLDMLEDDFGHDRRVRVIPFKHKGEKIGTWRGHARSALRGGDLHRL